jgi:hypothetical protein
MGIKSGKYGAVDGISTMRNWGVNETSGTKKFGASNTLGGAGRRRGNRDWTGSIGHYGGKPLVMPGDLFTFTGYTTPDSGISGAGKTRVGPAIVENIAVNWNWESADPVNTVINFAANGVLATGSGDISDVSNIDVPSPIGGGVRILAAGGSSYGTLCPVVSAALNVIAENKAYTNSCSSGQTQREPGNIDWNLALVIQEHDIDQLPFAIDDYIGIQIDVGEEADNFWQLTYGIVKDFTGIVVDRETGNIIQVTVNIEMSCDDNDSNIGEIILPGESTPWWPF